jgi:hypothetical protein
MCIENLLMNDDVDLSRLAEEFASRPEIRRNKFGNWKKVNVA